MNIVISPNTICLPKKNSTYYYILIWGGSRKCDEPSTPGNLNRDGLAQITTKSSKLIKFKFPSSWHLHKQEQTPIWEDFELVYLPHHHAVKLNNNMDFMSSSNHDRIPLWMYVSKTISFNQRGSESSYFIPSTSNNK